MSYDSISINIGAVEEALEKMRQARLTVETDRQKLSTLDTSGEGLTAQEHQQIETLNQVATIEAAIMDAVTALVGDTLEAYVTADAELKSRIGKALHRK